MSKEIRLDSSEWCDFVFAGKNKSYGAYRMREASTKRHLLAFLIVVIFAAFVAYLPTLIENVTPKKNHTQMIDVTQLSDLKLEEQVKEQNLIQQQSAPPPPPLKSTIRFTPPVITDEKIDDDQQMRSMDDLKETNLQISIADVTGTDEEGAVDIQDLQEHKVAIEEKVEKPYEVVEQMPQFPGGQIELLKFINDAIRYPVIAQENGIQGRVIIRFVVTATGEVSDVQVVRGLDAACDREAVRVVKSLPRWIPGKQNGRNVPVYYTLPVVYRLQ